MAVAVVADDSDDAWGAPTVALQRALRAHRAAV
jgi:hypothetical protein